MTFHKLSKIRQLLIVLLIVIIGAFLYFKIIPFGKISYERSRENTFRSGKGFISNFSPSDRIDEDIPSRIISDPIYFSIFTPRTFDRAKLIIKYKDNLSALTPIIEGGVLVDNLVWRYDLQPLENNIIESLKHEWPFIESGGEILLQKNQKYSDLETFRQDLSADNLTDCSPVANNCLALYNYPLNIDYSLPNWESQELVIDKPLRGPHQFYVYVQKGEFSIDVECVDLNQDKGADPITINVYRNNELIGQSILSDSNLNPTSAQVENKELSWQKNNLLAGVYKVEIKISNDMVIKKIVSSSDRLAFVNRVWPVSIGGPVDLFTDVPYIQVKALNPASRQNINFAGEEFSADEIYKQFEFNTLNKEAIKKIHLEKDDVILENNGVFAWDKSSLFNPEFTKVDSHFILNDSLEYIIANYISPKKEGGWKVATIDIDLKSAYREKGKYSFIISVPGLRAEDDINDYLDVGSIRIELEGRTLWQKIKSLF